LLLLVRADDESIATVDAGQALAEIRKEAITVLLALSFCQTKSSDSQNFATVMSQKQNFEVFQYAFLTNCRPQGPYQGEEEKATAVFTYSQNLSDYIIILQKLSQSEP